MKARCTSTGLRVVLLLAAIVVNAGCRPKPPPPRPTSVILLRGFQDWHSTGVDRLGDELRAAGAGAVVFPQAKSGEVGDALLNGDARRPLVLVGFSYGADDAIRIARRLGRAGRPVDLLVTIDPVTPPPVPRNVARCVNYYQSNGALDALPWLRGVPLTGDPGGPAVLNFDLRKDRTDLLQPDTSHATIAGHAGLRAEIVSRVLAVVGETPRAGTLGK